LQGEVGSIRHGFAGFGSRICNVLRHGKVGCWVTNMWGGTSRILDAEVAGSGVTDLQVLGLTPVPQVEEQGFRPLPKHFAPLTGRAAFYGEIMRVLGRPAWL